MFIYKQNVGNLTLVQFLKLVNSSKTAGFPLVFELVFENSSLEVSEKSKIVAKQAQPERKMRFISGELFDT